MFGRTLQSFTARNNASVLKGRALISTTYNSVSSQPIVPSKKVSYSTQAKPFTMTEKKLEEVRVPIKPTSPHLTIYRLPLPANISIMHRATGVSLGLGLFGVCATALFAPQRYHCLH
ncbi:hypothetical protein DICPUDRAFT_92482 [Dictyostelium purpureum]|uniref:Uncharacterized protein n=1 Tax=Dictyostelium purpureum TaxID=5786 RepID=F0ZSL1_DICPU|nr:uncharacterized protein DICPUDRAFT_92482 [Dictyostelium purpureum]EGC33066.1 hypothetical protein DICPUDRAFT_92482 [Dictyostelium purpureum]|eukprot:XP_003290416.1 hypothetical protein DICPUDRAFT_92482 [Dictyostelium purpureum]